MFESGAPRATTFGIGDGEVDGAATGVLVLATGTFLAVFAVLIVMLCLR